MSKVLVNGVQDGEPEDTVREATRDQTIARVMTQFCGFWSLLFAVCVFLLGNLVDSKQWVVLMQIQGGRYTWAAGFAIFSAAILFGQKTRNHVFDAWGCGLAGVSCFLVAAFYLIAPLLKDGFITLGMLPWFFPAFVAAFMAAVNATDRDW